jgi:transcription initiation factor TFIIF subunit alpha
MNPTPPSSGPAPHGQPLNGVSIYKKKTQNVDPLFKKRPQVRTVSKPLTNGRLVPPPKPFQRASPQSHRSASPSKASPTPEERISGFSDPLVTEGSYRDYRVVTTKRGLIDGLRFHLLQFAGDKAVDIRNEQEFVRPVRLHRRDPRGAPPGQIKEEGDEPKDGMDKAEREELNARKEARQREREQNLAQIAPSANPTKKLTAFKKKTAQVWRPDYTAEDRRRIQTNYEERLPWHLEDFDNKHCFVGSHQSGSSNVHAAFVYEPSLDSTTGKFRLLPVEKLYAFEPKRKQIKTMTIEEAEAAMKKRGTVPDWLVKQREARIQEAQRELVSRQARGLFSGAQKESIAGRQGEEADFDFEDDFADDEEGNPFEDKDEDVKIAEKRVKEDQLQANLFDLKEEKEYDMAEEMERKQEEARKKIGKKVNRALELREKNYNHGSDSDDMFDSV